MAFAVEAPKLGNTVEECLIARWLKHPGEPVAAGDVLAEIETDKATFEVNAPASGTLLAVFFAEGSLVPVFTNMCVIGEPGDDVEKFRPPAISTVSAPGDQPAAAVETTAPAAAPAGRAASGRFSPRARRFAGEHRFYPAEVAGSGPGGRVLEEDLRRAFHEPVGQAIVVRGLSAAGPRQVTKDDGRPVAGPRQATKGDGLSHSTRLRIAKRMRESLATTAQYTLNSSAPAAGLLRLRERSKTSPETAHITINDLVAFCTIQALLEFPELNAEFIDNQARKHSEVHLGFACDTPRGLLVPVIRDAHALSVAGLASRAKELAAHAVQGNISPDDLTGGTFTISNLGALGIESFTPLLNPPQVAILGVGAIQLKPERSESGIEFIDSIGLSLTCDHQWIDGAPGARFLKTVAEKIASVETICTI